MDLESFFEKAGKLGAASALSIFIGAALSLGMSGLVFNQWRSTLLASRYTKETLVIDSVRMGKMGRRGPKDIPIATGTVNGHPETISLMDFELRVDSLEDLQKQFPPGSDLEILYDSTAPEMMVQGRYLRGLPPESDQIGSWSKALGITMIPGTPIFAGVIGLLVCYWRQRSGADPSVSAQ